MKVVLFGATGMVGQGVLRECVRDEGVHEIVAVGRRRTGASDPRLREIVLPDLLDLSGAEDALAGAEACFYCLGVSSTGVSEAEYRRVTLDVTLAAGRAMARRSPGTSFVFVSGAGADATGRSRLMWARVKGEAENALRALDLKTTVFRPGFIQPGDGIVSRTGLYRAFYAVAAPLFPVLERLAPRQVTSTERIGRAMLAVVRRGAPRDILDSGDINALARPRA